MNNNFKIQFEAVMYGELEKMIMSWDNDLRMWHVHAINALPFITVFVMGVRQDKYGEKMSELKRIYPQGIGMNTVAVLSNNIEARSMTDMGMNESAFNELLQLNHRVSERWELLVKPVRDRVMKRFQIMGNKPILKTIKGEA
jgi:hypothetical protein